MERMPTIWTIGHSTMPLASFLSLLRSNDIEYLVDVRSRPYSRFVPHYNREELRASLEGLDIGYVSMGSELGGRPHRKDHLDDQGHALYGKMAREPAFVAAIGRLERGCSQGRIAIMCGCGRPQDCHRRLLVGKVLCERCVTLRHILADGDVMEETSVPLGDSDMPSLFADEEQLWRSTRSVSPAPRPRASSAA